MSNYHQSNYRSKHRAAHEYPAHSSHDDNNFVTLPRDVYEKLMHTQSTAPRNEVYHDDHYVSHYGEQPYDAYGYSAYVPSSGYAHCYSIEPYRPPQQTFRPKNAGPVSSTLYHRPATDFFRNEIQNIDRKYFQCRQSTKTIIIDSTILFGRFYMNGDEVLGNKAEELIRDMSLLWLQRAACIMVEVASGWRDDRVGKGIRYIIGYRTLKGKGPTRMTKTEIDQYMLNHPFWNEQKKSKILQY